jgi:Glyoxalase-like domain
MTEDRHVSVCTFGAMAAPLRAGRSMIQAGASIAWANDTVRGNSIAMRDPEGNEFCVS